MSDTTPINDPLEQSLDEYADLGMPFSDPEPEPETETPQAEPADQGAGGLQGDNVRIVFPSPTLNGDQLAADVICTITPVSGGLTKITLATRKDRALTVRYSTTLDLSNTGCLLSLGHFQKLLNEMLNEMSNSAKPALTKALKADEIGKLLAAEMKKSVGGASNGLAKLLETMASVKPPTPSSFEEMMKQRRPNPFGS